VEETWRLLTVGVQINNGNVIPTMEKHPQDCLHLAYILPVTDFPTPGVSPAPVLQDLTIGSSWGSRNNAAAVQQPCSSHVITGTSVYEGHGTHARRGGLNRRCCNSATTKPAGIMLHAPTAERKIADGDTRCKNTNTQPSGSRKVFSSSRVNGRRLQAT